MLIGFSYLNAAAIKLFFTVSSRPGVFIWIKNVLCEVWRKPKSGVQLWQLQGIYVCNPQSVLITKNDQSTSQKNTI